MPSTPIDATPLARLRAAVVIVVLGACAGLGLAACTNPPDTVSGRPTPACGDTTTQPATLPDGATWAQLCDGSSDAALMRVAPPDRLTTDVAGLVAAYHRLPRQTTDMACTMELSSAYVLQIGYRDGTVVALRGELYGCRVVGARTGADSLVGEFVSRLTAQRRATPPTPKTDPTAGLGCSWFGPQSWMPVSPSDTSAAFACVEASGSTRAEPRSFTAEETSVVLADVVAHAREAALQPCTDARSGRAVVLVTSWGEALAFHEECGAFTQVAYAPRGDPVTRIWEPSPPVRRLLESVFAR